MVTRCFFNDTATTEIYTHSLHDALPILRRRRRLGPAARGRHDDRLVPLRRDGPGRQPGGEAAVHVRRPDRKSTRLNSSHANISYAVFRLTKKATSVPRMPRA